MRTRPGLLLLLLTVAATTRPAAGPTATFTSDEYGFRLKYPASWTVPEHPDEGQAFTARSPPLPTTQPATQPAAGPGPTIAVVSLKIGGGPDGMSDRQIVHDGSDLLAAAVFEHGGQHVTVRPGTLGGVPGRRIRYAVDRPDGRVEVLTVLAAHKRVTYVLTVTAPAGRLDPLLRDVEAMLASFDLRD